MRFTVISYGSEGDTRPIAAVCKGLLDAGHEVYFFCEASSLPLVQAHNIPSEALAGDIKATLPLDDPSRELGARDIIRTARAGLRVVNAHVEQWARRVVDHAATSDAILFSGLTLLLGPAVAQALRKPAIGLMLQPLLASTHEFPSAMFPPLSLPGWLNRLSYPLAHRLLDRFYGRSTEAALRSVCGRAGSVLHRHEGAVLYGFSRFLVTRPDAWPANHRICGPWSLPAEDRLAPPTLVEFLADGPTPLYVGFGALSSFVRQRRLAEIVAAVANRRVVFYPGWSQIDQSMLPGNFLVVGHTDHAWLFPRVSLVMHHGGAGTTHTAARAGVPSVVTPFGVDQFFWAHRLAAVGVAPGAVRPGRVNQDSLRRMIDLAETAAMRERARSLGSEMATEDGVRCAVREIVAQTEAPR